MTIAEIAKKYDITQDTLRYYEKIGVIPHIHRNSGGIRSYTEDDCRWIEFIKCLRSAGLTIEGLIKFVSLYHQGGDENFALRKGILLEQRAELTKRIEEMNATLERLNGKIAWYEQAALETEKELKPRE